MTAVRHGLPTDATTVDDLQPTLVVPEILATVAEEEVFRPLARQFDLTGEGITSTIAQPAALTFTALNEDAAVEPVEQAFTTSARSLTTAQYQVDVIITLKALQDSISQLQPSVIAEVGRALLGHRDGLGAANWGEAATANQLGTENIPISFAELRDGQALLHAARAPRSPKKYSWVVYPAQFAELLQDDTFINASVKGSPVLTNGIGANGYATSALDVDVYVSPAIVDSTGHRSMMFAEGSLGYAFKRLAAPGQGMAPQELMIDLAWNSGFRQWEINTTYECHFVGIRDTVTTQTWMVDVAS